MKKLIALFVFLAVMLSAWLWWTTKKNNAAAGFWGDYELDSYNCEDCIGCFVRLSPGYRYDVFQKDSLLLKGDWSLGHDYQSAMFFLEFDNGYKGNLNSFPKKISSITTISCRIKNCQELLGSSFKGEVIGFEPYKKKKHKKSVILLTEKGDTLLDNPKSFFHPWLQDTVEIGDFLIKKKGLLDYLLIKTNGDSILLNYPEPDC